MPVFVSMFTFKNQTEWSDQPSRHTPTSRRFPGDSRYIDQPKGKKEKGCCSCRVRHHTTRDKKRVQCEEICGYRQRGSGIMSQIRICSKFKRKPVEIFYACKSCSFTRFQLIVISISQTMPDRLGCTISSKFPGAAKAR